MTVGELVRKTENGPMMTSYERALRDLGIWDAEVLEGLLGVAAPDGAVYAEDIVVWTGPRETFLLGRPGQRVRLIVLSQEEK